MLTVFDTRTNHHENPIGIDYQSLRFSWKLQSDKRSTRQTAYQIQAAVNNSFTSILWDSGKVKTDLNTAANYEGPDLASRERVFWRIKVWSVEEESDFSDACFFEMGLLTPSDWQAGWIEMEHQADPFKSNPEPVLRRSFSVKPGLAYARIYSTAHGCYSAAINGKKITKDLFLPGFTIYPERLQYQVYDITPLLAEGENVLAVLLGDGWWRGAVGAFSHHNLFGYKLAYLCQLELCYADGSREVIASDDSFKTTYGPLVKSDTKCGEVYDARILPAGWEMPGFDDSSWENAWVVDYGKNNLIAPAIAPVRKAETFSPIVLTTPDGSTVLDFGQNIAGFVELSVTAPAGTKIKLTHSEVLDEAGNFTIEHYDLYGTADGRKDTFQEEVYVCAGNGEERFAPLFAIFGFRYVLVEEFPGQISPDMFTAHAVYCAMPQTGGFSCSNPLINKLVQNSLWSQKGNFMFIPTDCPTRERAGWTGDAQLYCKTATFFMDTYTFYQKWMQDVAIDQTPSGKIRNYTPTAIPYHFEENLRLELLKGEPDSEELRNKLREQMESGEIIDGSAGWGDAATILPWTLYNIYGDDQIVRNQYSSAKKWVEYITANAKMANPALQQEPWYQNGDDAMYVWDTCFHFGEWLEPDFGADMDIGDEIDKTESLEILRNWMAQRAVTGDPTLATAYYFYSAGLMSKMAELLGNKEDQEHYEALSRRIKEVYNKYFIKEDGSILERRQAPLARALAFDLVNEDKKELVAHRLAQYVADNGYHLNTGFLSTPFLLAALSRNGYVDTAFRLLEQKDSPSWLFQIENGATTVCERWDAYIPGKKPDLSCNHYAYGAVCDFLFSDIAGIRTLCPGYREFEIRPTLGGSLTWASAEFDSPQGKIYSAWRVEGENVLYTIQVPANSVAYAYIPADADQEIPAGAVFEAGTVKYTLGSGMHELKGKVLQ